MLSNPTELMNAAERPYCSKILDSDMSSESGGVYKDGFITDKTVMANMRVSHEIIIIPDNSLPSGLDCPPVNSYEFSENISIPDLNQCVFPSISNVLRFCSDGRIWRKMAVFSYFSLAINEDIGIDSSIFVDTNFFPDKRIWSYPDS
jgi:hypothetical protein